MKLSEIEKRVESGELNEDQAYRALVSGYIKALEADARRYQYIRDNQTWTRHGIMEERDSYALVGCKFPYLANFSSKNMLDYHIDKALEAEDAGIIRAEEGSGQAAEEGEKAEQAGEARATGQAEQAEEKT